jgi:DNA-binding NtrC family response regulator
MAADAAHETTATTPAAASPATAEHATSVALCGSSAALLCLLEHLHRAAPADHPVLLVGERHVGKRSLARWLHDHGRFPDQPCTVVDCAGEPHAASMAEHLLGGGHDGPGLVTATGAGTLVLRDVEALLPAVQHALARASLRCRVVLTSTADPDGLRDMSPLVAALAAEHGLVLTPVPALRSRREDVPAMAQAVLADLAPGSTPQLSRAAERALEQRPWPGNLAELRDALAHALRHAPGTRIRESDLWPDAPADPAVPAGVPRDLLELPYKDARDDLVSRFERAYATHAMETCDGNVARAASRCGLSRQALHALLLRTGVAADDFRSRRGRRGGDVDARADSR